MNGIKVKRIVINQIKSSKIPPTVPFHTTSQNKQKEIKRILGEDVIFVEGLPDVPEIQDRDPYIVAKLKAIMTYEAYGYEPVIVEDISLIIHDDQDILVPTTVKEWAGTRAHRKKVCERLGKDRSATALVIYGVFDGEEFHYKDGVTEGTIATYPIGPDKFGWDDIFIPDGDTRTFAQMTPQEKDSYSMRRKALKKIKKDPFPTGEYIFQIQEPFPNEIARIRIEELIDKTAIQFAFNVDSLKGNEPNDNFEARTYAPIYIEEVRYNGVVFYRRYTIDPKSENLGLIETDFIKSRIKTTPNGDPIIWQMGPERRRLALSQRAEYFLENQNQRIHTLLDKYEHGKIVIPHRSNKRHPAIDRALGAITEEVTLRGGQKIPVHTYTQTEALTTIGYGKISADRRVSRQPQNNDEVFNKIGKYYRRVISAGSMPPATGSADVLATMALGHMIAWVPRNSRYAGYLNRQIALYKRAVQKITALSIPVKWKKRAKRNIGASLGTDNPEEIVKEAEQFYKIGVQLFRIYTINSDPRVVETARALRKRFGDKIEVFVGQIPDKKLAKQLIAKDVHVDAIFLGHGGGQQCDSGGNGMAIKTLEEITDLATDPEFNNTTIAVEGSVERDMGTYLLAGADLFSYNQRIVNSGIENAAGDIYFEHINSTEEDPIYVQPYAGSASPETQTIEAVNPRLNQKRIKASGRTKGPEGISGFMKFHKKTAGSMVFWIDCLLSDSAKGLADNGVSSIAELRTLQHYLPINASEEEVKKALSNLRLVGASSQAVARPHGFK